MELVHLADLEMTYRTLEVLDYGAEGQVYGSLDGLMSGDRLAGRVELTNLAVRRTDGVNLPTLRGVLRTDDGAAVWMECDGVATLRAADGARVFVTTVRLRSGDDRYRWVNTVVGVSEGVLDSIGVGGVARSVLLECRPTVT